jgi:uncharacterized protein (TIGR03435 family)
MPFKPKRTTGILCSFNLNRGHAALAFWSLAVGVLSLGSADAQTPRPSVAAGPAFEVASIKPSTANILARNIRPYPGGRVVAQGTTLRFLIEWAYQVGDFQVSKTPGWMDSDRYDVEAKAPAGVDQSPPQLRLMFRTLLANRFKLALHRESKDADTYVLTVAKGGPKLHPSDDAGCVSSQDVHCGGTSVSPGMIRATQGNLPLLAAALSAALGGPVSDQTGLTGAFDFQLQWTPEYALPTSPGEAPVRPSPDSKHPFLSTALQEQLGLKLASQKGKVEMLVIDHAEKPSSN